MKYPAKLFLKLILTVIALIITLLYFTCVILYFIWDPADVIKGIKNSKFVDIGLSPFHVCHQDHNGRDEDGETIAITWIKVPMFQLAVWPTWYHRFIGIGKPKIIRNPIYAEDNPGNYEIV